MSSVTFRPAAPGDEELMLSFIRALADYEHMTDQVVATPALLRELIFEKKKAEVLFALDEGRAVGFALFFHNFSTFLGRAGIYLEDLFVLPQERGKGYGKALLDESLARAAAMGAGAVCIEGNIAFYGHCGFAVAGARGIRYYAEPEREIVPYFLLRELKPGYLDGVTGVYRPSEGYFVDAREAEAFDAQFPPKIRRKLPGQLFE